MAWLSKAWPRLLEAGFAITGFAIIWTELVLWALGIRTPDPTLSGIAAGAVVAEIRRRAKRVRTALGSGETSSSSPASSSPSPPQSQSLPPGPSSSEEHPG